MPSHKRTKRSYSMYRRDFDLLNWIAKQQTLPSRSAAFREAIRFYSESLRALEGKT